MPSDTGDALRRAKARLMQMNAAAHAQREGAEASDIPAPLEAEAPEALGADKPAGRPPVKIVFNIPGKEIIAPVHGILPPSGPSKPAPIFRPVFNVPVENAAVESQPNDESRPRIADAFSDSPYKFRLPVRLPKPTPEFKEPFLPDRVVVEEFNKMSVSPAKPTGRGLLRQSSSRNVLDGSKVAVRRRRE